MELPVVLLLLSSFSSLFLLFFLGANDVANSIALPLNASALTAPQAIGLAAICNILGATLGGAHVTSTLSHSVSPVLASDFLAPTTALAFLCATLSAAITILLGTYLALPLSSTHAIVGGVAGAALLLSPVDGIRWPVMFTIFAAWILSPILGAMFGAVFVYLVNLIERGGSYTRFILAAFCSSCVAVVGGSVGGGALKAIGIAGWGIPIGLLFAFVGALVGWIWTRDATYTQPVDLEENEETPASRTWCWLLRLTVVGVAFAHGSNDVANGVGPFVAVLRYYLRKENVGNLHMLGALCVGGGAIAFGLATFGGRVVKTVGGNEEGGLSGRVWSFGRGFAAEFAAMVCVLVASRCGWPVSTSHVVVGAVVGVGMMGGAGEEVQEKEGVRWDVLTRVLIGGGLTPILSGVGSAAMLAATRGLVK